jgi:HD-like signal output (HDOD) protein
MSISPQLKDRIEHLSNLPTLPKLATHLLEVINSPDAGAADVANLAGRDVSMSAKILRLANSAYYGSPHKIASIQTAVVRLGLRVIRTIVLSLTVFDMFPAGKSRAKFDRTAFWRHCVRCGFAARFLTAAKGIRETVDPEEAFCGGLLHDMGKIVMEQYLHEDFRLALEHARQKKLPFFSAENETLGYNHADVAMWMISGWGLPDSLYWSIAAHHEPYSAQESGFFLNAAICNLADRMCYDSQISKPDSGIMPSLHEKLLETAGFNEEKLSLAANSFSQSAESISEFFDIINAGN